MYRIGEFSKMGKITVKALRYYDEIGLLKPAGVDEWTGYRFYTAGQLFDLHQIQSYRQIGLTIREIQQIQKGTDPQLVLHRRRKELEDDLARGAEQISRIDFMLSEQKEESPMSYQAIIKDIPECIIYSKELTVPGYDTYFQVIPAIGEQLAAKYPDLKCAVPEYCFIRYLDGEYKEKDIHIEFCEAVTEQKEDFDDIRFRTEPGTTVASVMHKGPYSDLRGAYAYLLKWIEENGYEACDYARESYIDGIWNKENESEWLTEIQMPVKKL